MGLSKPLQVKRDLEELLGCEVFEIPGLPPSIPGIRLHNILVKAIEMNGGRVSNGMLALYADTESAMVKAVWTEAAARQLGHRAAVYVLATGGVLGGGISAPRPDRLLETTFNLALSPDLERLVWFSPDFLDQRGHPVFQSGIPVNERFQPVDARGQIAFSNLYAVGTGLEGADFIRLRSFDGVALASAYLVGSHLADRHSPAQH